MSSGTCGFTGCSRSEDVREVVNQSGKRFPLCAPCRAEWPVELVSDSDDDHEVMTDGGEDSPDATNAILNQIRERTEADPDGKQDANGNVWTGRRRLRSDAVKDWADWTKDDVDRSVAALKRRGEIVVWHGLLAPAEPDHLTAIIENERMADIPRQTIIGRCNKLLNGEGDGDE